MQYLEADNSDDLKSGYTTYALQCSNDKISFYAYTGDTAINADAQGKELNANKRGYFLRKGFYASIRDADPNIIVPIYRNNEGKEVIPASTNEAIKLINKDELNITGFKFQDNATEIQRDRAFGKMINSFVATSKNLDFRSDKNLFFVINESSVVKYNNGGSDSTQISGVDVQEKLHLNTSAVKLKSIMHTEGETKETKSEENKTPELINKAVSYIKGRI